MFEQVLDELADDADLLNQVLEIAVEDGEEFHILSYYPRTRRTPAVCPAGLAA